MLAAKIKPDQKARLDALLVVPEGGRQSPMDRLCSGPTLQSTAELARAIERLDDMRQLAAVCMETACGSVESIAPDVDRATSGDSAP
jgi:hypothetical protein